MAFIVKSESREAVRERIDYIVDCIEKQGRFNFQLYVRESADRYGWCEGRLKLQFHKPAYPSDYKKPDRLRVLPGSHS